MGLHGLGRSPDPVAPRLGRRRLGGLAAALGAGLAAPVAPRAQGALRRAAQSGEIRVALDAGLAVAAPGSDRPADPFNEAVAGLLAAQFGLRARIRDAGGAGGALAALLAGEADIALAPPLSRPGLRQAAFAPPHAVLDLVVVSPLGERVRLRRQLRGQVIGLLGGQAEALAARGDDDLAQARLLGFGDVLALEAALRGSEISLAVVARHQARWLVARNAWLAERLSLVAQRFAAAVAHGDHDLTHAVDIAMQDVLRGRHLPALFERHIGLPWQPPRGS